MTGFLVRWFVDTLALAAVVRFVPGFSVDSWQTLAMAALVFGLVNATLRPLALALLWPLAVLSLGFLVLAVNGFMLYAVSRIIPGFSIAGFASAFWGALAASGIGFILNLCINPVGRIQTDLFFRRQAVRRRRGEVIDVQATVDGRTAADTRKDHHARP